MPRVVKISIRFFNTPTGSVPKMSKACWMLFAVLFLVCLQRSWSQMQLTDLMQNDQGLNYDSGWPPGQSLNYMRMARDLKTHFFQSLTGEKQPAATGGGGGAGADGNKRRDRITALFIRLMTRLFRQRPFQRLLCGSNATCLANLNTPAF